LIEKFISTFENRVLTNAAEKEKNDEIKNELAQIIQFMHTQRPRNMLHQTLEAYITSILPNKTLPFDAQIRSDSSDGSSLNIPFKVKMDFSQKQPIIFFKSETKNINLSYYYGSPNGAVLFPLGTCDCTCEFAFQLRKQPSRESSPFKHWELIDTKVEIEKITTGLEFLNPEKIRVS